MEGKVSSHYFHRTRGRFSDLTCQLTEHITMADSDPTHPLAYVSCSAPKNCRFFVVFLHAIWCIWNDDHPLSRSPFSTINTDLKLFFYIVERSHDVVPSSWMCRLYGRCAIIPWELNPTPRSLTPSLLLHISLPFLWILHKLQPAGELWPWQRYPGPEQECSGPQAPC